MKFTEHICAPRRMIPLHCGDSMSFHPQTRLVSLNTRYKMDGNALKFTVAIHGT